MPNVLNMIDSGSSISFNNSFKICECIWPGPMELWTFRFLKWSQTWFSPTMCSSSFSQCLSFWNLSSVVGALDSGDWGEKIIEYLRLLHVTGKQVSYFFPKGSHFFLNVPFITKLPIEIFLVDLNIPGQVWFFQGFPDPCLFRQSLSIPPWCKDLKDQFSVSNYSYLSETLFPPKNSHCGKLCKEATAHLWPVKPSPPAEFFSKDTWNL